MNLAQQKIQPPKTYAPEEIAKIREDFPILKRKIHGKNLIYFDNAATSLKPNSVVDVIERHYRFETANVHRGIHTLSEQATAAYELARVKVQKFINAKETHEIIFTRGTTGSINLVAQSYGRHFLKKGDEILISHMEHHSNIVPWQILCEEKGCILKVIPIDDCGDIIFDEYKKLLNAKTKIVAINYISNTLGTINPIKDVICEAHRNKTLVLIDGAQAMAHLKVDVQDLDCDFFAFSSHKMFGPTGIGVLYGKTALLGQMPPADGGGDMIETVTFAKTTYNVLPQKFEAGTPHVAGVIGLGAAIDYLNTFDFEKIHNHEIELLNYATLALQKIEGLKIIGTAKEKSSIISFVIDGVHPHDLATLIDFEGVAIRTGHHCTQPLMERFGITATARASFAVYNTKEEIDEFITAIHKVKGLF